MFAKNKKRKSLIVLIAVAFWIFYISFTAIQYYWSANELADKQINDRKNTLTFILTNSVNTLVTDNLSLFNEQIKKSCELYLINFFILQKNGAVVSFENSGGSVDGINLKYTTLNKFLDVGDFAIKTIKISDYTLTAGILKNKNMILWQTFLSIKYMFLRDILSVTVFLFLILYLFLKDIVSLAKILSQKDRSGAKNVRSMSSEGNTLLKAALGFENSQQQLKIENRHYSDTITPAILHEVKSGKQAPYSFDSTLIRVDLNGYTQIFLEKNDEYITSIMSAYFLQAREIIERYHGLIYQYVGDEIVFHIKEKNHNSQALAIACVRSLFEIASEIEANLPPEAGHYFKIKTSFSYGKMRFVQLDTGYGLSGLPLIETARLLTQVEEKSKHSACFYVHSHSNFPFLCKIEQHSETVLKGFSEAAQIAKTTSFRGIEEVLCESDFKNIFYFRSDNDIMSVCNYFAEKISSATEKDFFTAFSYLSSFKIHLTSKTLVNSFSNLLRTAIQKNRDQQLSDKALSAVITLVNHLIPTSFISTEILDSLNDCLDHKDHRTCANTIIVLGELSENRTFLREFIHSANNRISADAMLVAGKHEMDGELAAKIEEYIRSKNPLYQASGLFVANTLVTHFKSTNPVYFETNRFLQRLNSLIPIEKNVA